MAQNKFDSKDLVLDLINADSNEPFLKHTDPSGKVYVEVEPKTQYYIRLQNNSCKDIVINPIIDKDALGYTQKINQGQTCKLGTYHEKDGVCTETSLYLHELGEKEKVEDYSRHDYQEKFTFGKVKIEIYSCVYFYYKPEPKPKSESFTFNWESTIAEDSKHPNAWKIVKSKIGDNILKKYSARSSNQSSGYTKGTYLDCIKVRYCSARGLCYAKILPPLPLTYNTFSSKRPFPLVSPIHTIEPTFIERTIEEDGIITKKENIPFFDLTQIPDSEDEGQDEGENQSELTWDKMKVKIKVN